MDKNQERSLVRQIWMPVAFCAFLSVGKLWLPGGAGDPAFFSFLPFCFWWMATVQWALLKRIRTLESSARGISGEPDTATPA